jgi:hypothetical protein
MVVPPTSSSLACNILWFLSLGFSLSCALIATLVEQWSRDFIQSTEMRPSPVIRARIFAYLYFGLQKFGMHSLIQFIPLLLHISLLLFFAGLVAFLHPINAPLTAVAAALLGSIITAYIYLTVLPMFSSDSPYRTPLSNMAWVLFRRFGAPLSCGRRSSPDEESKMASGALNLASGNFPTMVEIMMQDAVEKSRERDDRDGRAMAWTIRSLTDDNELEPFVEALPDLVWGPNGRRRVHDDMINMFLETPDIRLIFRIEGLLRGCDSGLLSQALETRRRISCVKALWAIAHFSASNAVTRKSFPEFDHALLASYLNSMNTTPTVRHHLTSAYAVVRWSGFCSLSSLIHDALGALASVANTSLTLDPRPSLKMVQRRAEDLADTQFSDRLSHLLSLDLPTIIQQSSDVLTSFDDHAYDILIEYLCSSADLEEMPHEFEATSSMIQQVWARPSTVAEIKLKQTFSMLVDIHYHTICGCPTVHPIDIGVDTILHLLQANPECLDTAFFQSLVLYMSNRRKAQEIWTRMFARCDPSFVGSLLTKCLVTSRGYLTDHSLFAIWASCYVPEAHYFATFDEEALAAVCTAQQSFFSSCTTAVLKAHIAPRAAIQLPVPRDGLMGSFQSPPSSTAVPDTAEQWKTHWFAILVEFLECRDAFRVLDPWHAHVDVETFSFLIRSWPVDGVSRPEPLQRRFAHSFLKIITGTRESRQSHADLIDRLVLWLGWNHGMPAIQGFDDPDARERIRGALMRCWEALADGKLVLPDYMTGVTMKGLIVQLASDTSDLEAPSRDGTGSPEQVASGEGVMPHTSTV